MPPVELVEPVAPAEFVAAELVVEEELVMQFVAQASLGLEEPSAAQEVQGLVPPLGRLVLSGQGYGLLVLEQVGRVGGLLPRMGVVEMAVSVAVAGV